MVRKDVNHPSVILYSIGNEIPEAGRPDGRRVRAGPGREDPVARQHPSRHPGRQRVPRCGGGSAALRGAGNEIDSSATDEETGVNTALTNLADRLNKLMLSPVVATKSAETLSYLDVAGYNYMDSRYELDGRLYPNRVIVGSETHAAAIATGWAKVVRHPHLIGDFTWTGWDYLGEAGIGRVLYASRESLRRSTRSWAGTRG